MKRRMTLSIALVVSVVLVSLMSSDSTAQAQQPQRFRFATGVVTPSASQKLRVTVVGTDGDATARVRFLWARYAPAGCNGTPAVCRYSVDTQGSTPMRTLNPNDVLSFDIDVAPNGDLHMAITAESNSRDVRVNVMIIDSATGEVAVGWKVEAGEK